MEKSRNVQSVRWGKIIQQETDFPYGKNIDMNTYSEKFNFEELPTGKYRMKVVAYTGVGDITFMNLNFEK